METIKERRFTFGQLEFRRLTPLDITILSIFLIAVLVELYTLYIHSSKVVYGLIYISFLVSFQTIGSTIGLRFRNVYFSIIWLACCLLFLINPYPIAKLPLLSFLLYHILRLVFWKLHNREFIPYSVAKGELIRFFSKTEGRVGGTKDRLFMRILISIGCIILICGFISMIGYKFSNK